MLTFSGVHVTRDFGAPTIRDIAVQGMRIVRFSGAAEIFWPIGMHMLVVADLMPKAPWMEVHGLLHDAAEVCVADVPRPMKTAEARALEDRVTARIYASLGVPAPSDEIKAAIKEADFRAALAEGTIGCSGRGYTATQTGYRRDQEAEAALMKYLKTYRPSDAINPDGCWSIMYEDRLRRALREAQHAVSYAPDAEVSSSATVPERDDAVIGAIKALYRTVPERDDAVIGAIKALYHSQEHRPSCEAVQRTVLRAMHPEVAGA